MRLGFSPGSKRCTSENPISSASCDRLNWSHRRFGMGQIAIPTRLPSVPVPPPAPSTRVRRGAPQKYDYAQINTVFEKLVSKDGYAVLKDFNRVKESLIKHLGESGVPSESQLRRHLKAWEKIQASDV